MTLPLRNLLRYLIVFLTLIAIGVGLHFSINSYTPTHYAKLDEIYKYSLSLPEFPEPQNKDWEAPLYSKFYKDRSFFLTTYISQLLGIKDISKWNASYLVSILDKLANDNYEKGLTSKENNLAFIRAKPTDRFFIFGDAHSAFHSLVRDLLHLHKQNLISNDLKLSDNTFIVFNGNAIDRSAYNIDTLTLIALLLKNNPNQVIYLAGKHERKGYWLNYSLREELVNRASHLSDETVPFQQEIMDFFQTLPIALYLKGEHDTKETIRISSLFSSEKGLYSEANISFDKLGHEDRVNFFTLEKVKTKKASALDIRALFESQNWRHFNRIKQGLGLMDQTKGATTWSILSSPILVNRIYLGFNYDAFVELTIPDRVENATLTAMHQDTRDLSGYKTTPPRNIVSGGATLSSRKSSIKVGSSLSLVQGLPIMAYQLSSGMNLAINNHNSDTAQGKYLVRLYVENDDYVPRLARLNTMSFIDEGIRFFMMPLGTPTLTACLDLLENSHSVVFFPQSGSSTLRKKELPQLIHYRASYEDEARALISVMGKEYAAKKYALFYQEDAFGQGPFEAAVVALKKQGIKDILALPYTRGTVSFERQVEEFKRFSPDALGFFAVGSAATELIRQIGLNDLLSTQLFGISVVGTVQLRRYVAKLGTNMLLSNPVPNPFLDTFPIVAEFNKAMKDANNIVDSFALEGYIGGRLLLYALDKLNKENPTPQEVSRVLESIKNVDFEGLPFNFNPETRSLAQAVWVETDNSKPWRQLNIDGK